MTQESRNILVIGEYFENNIRPVSFELTSKARELSLKIGAEVSLLVMGYGIRDVEVFGDYGASFVYYVDDISLKDFDDKIYADIATAVIKDIGAEIVIAPATSIGRSFIPRVATYLETGLTADCVDLDIDIETGNLIQKRPAWGGNMIANILCPNARPQMATVRPGIFSAAKVEKRGDCRINRLDISQFSTQKGFDVLGMERDEHINSLTNCNVVFAVGRGVKKELIPLLQDVSRLIGAGLGCTRPISDDKILPYSAQIGQSGVFVSPKVCISMGISGAIQYTMGIKGAEINIAVNRDPNAQIFDVADYVIVGDVNEFISLLCEKIKKIKGIN